MTCISSALDPQDQTAVQPHKSAKHHLWATCTGYEGYSLIPDLRVLIALLYNKGVYPPILEEGGSHVARLLVESGGWLEVFELKIGFDLYIY